MPRAGAVDMRDSRGSDFRRVEEDEIQRGLLAVCIAAPQQPGWGSAPLIHIHWFMSP